VTLQDERPQTRLLLPDAPTPGPERGSPRRRLGVGVAAALVALLAYAVSGPPRTTGDEAAAAPVDETRRGDTAAAPDSGDPSVRYPQTRAGAQSAAPNYVVAFGGAAMFDTDRRHAVVRRIADPAVEPTLQRQLDEVFAAVMARFGLDEQGRPPDGLTFVCRALPVGVRLLDYTGDTAQISVWTAGIIGLAGESSTRPVAEAWSTTTVSLRWSGGDWKWFAFSQQDGPTPVSGLQPPSSATAIADAVRNYGELGSHAR